MHVLLFPLLVVGAIVVFASVLARAAFRGAADLIRTAQSRSAQGPCGGAAPGLADRFRYEIGQAVCIELTGAEGVVRGLWLDEQSKRLVQVRYHDDHGGIHDAWFTEQELTTPG